MRQSIIKCKYLIIISLASCVYIQTYAQPINRKNLRETKKFLKFIRATEFNGYNFLKIENYLCNKNLFSGVILSGNGTYGLSNEEKIFLQKHFKDTSKYIINKHFLKNIEFVNENDSNYWKLSKPIFLRNYSICIFSFESIIKPEGSEEWTYMYKKENRKWSKLFPMAEIRYY
ncbi:hypothetical protein [Hydrotalea sandarakina]|jgi:hypothetical protein|uniref:Uncharacterized protein n=1 Tax=Hydrotalea sandarakina TaxID=1004304 RepID=A0A2W7S6G5_9BACT|nr:hypothetical protein [Hydrotalea sandarakina]PZX62827.1 hypothetical protein LX80_01521 [Hydrotalea sandarakina]